MIQNYSADEVRAAVTKVFTETDFTDGPSLVVSACHVLGQTRNTNNSRDEWDRLGKLDRQIRRAADAMAAGGGLVKIKRGHLDPSGSQAIYAYYYTNAGHAKAIQKATEERLEREDKRKRRAIVYDRLVSQYGITPAHPRGHAIQVSLENWEKLLGIDPV